MVAKNEGKRAMAFNVLSSNKAEDYCQCEKACVREYNAKRQPSAAAGAPPKTATPPCKC